MADYVVQGKKGAGKTITAVGRIKHYLENGFPVATNLDIQLDVLLSPFNKSARLTRLPDQPRVQDLELLGYGNTSPDEEKNGLIVFDECATWFNSRTWNDKARKGINDWLLHSRKRGWDVYYLVQDNSAMDSQARELFMEHLVTCRRLDRMNIPILGTSWKLLTGTKLALPRAHIASVVYGDTKLVVDRWVMRGNELFEAYDTKQIFSPNYIAEPGESGFAGNYSLLPPWNTKGYKKIPRNWGLYMRLSKLYFRKLKSAIFFGVGVFATCLIFGLAFAIAEVDKPEPVPQVVEKPLLPFREVPGTIVSSMEIIHSYGRGDKASASVKILAGGLLLDLTDLRREGFKITKISDCRMFAESASVRYVATCPFDDSIDKTLYRESTALASSNIPTEQTIF